MLSLGKCLTCCTTFIILCWLELVWKYCVGIAKKDSQHQHSLIQADAELLACPGKG